MNTSMMETIVYLGWWLVVKTIKIIQYILLAVIPDFVVRREVIKIFEGQCGIKLTTEPSAITGNYNRKKYQCEMVIHNPRFFQRLAQDDLLALGESYMDGWWDADRVDKVITCLLRGTSPNLIHKAEDALYVAGNRQTREKSLQVAKDHYNLGNDLFEAMLGPTMNYTCAYWKDDTKTLDEAQMNKMDLIARKLQLKPGMTVLDLGSGFGSMAKYLAQNYHVSVTGYNISAEQVAYARRNCEGLDGVTFVQDDYRNATGQYDRVYSVGFFEHVGVHNYREYFSVVHRCLKDDGITLLHSITIQDGQTRTPKFLRDYIFPGGELPYANEYLQYSKGLLVCEDVQSLGKSYRKTLLAWWDNFQASWEETLAAKYGSDACYNGKFFRMWQFYLLMCAGCFESRACYVHQLVFTKPCRREEYHSVR